MRQAEGLVRQGTTLHILAGFGVGRMGSVLLGLTDNSSSRFWNAYR